MEEGTGLGNTYICLLLIKAASYVVIARRKLVGFAPAALGPRAMRKTSLQELHIAMQLAGKPTGRVIKSYANDVKHESSCTEPEIR